MSFSIGDLLAITKLACEIISTLRESASSPSDYQAVVRQLDSVKESLTATILSLESAKLPRSVLNALRVHTSECSRLLRELQCVIGKYRRHLRNGGGGRTKGVWKRVSWVFFKSDELVVWQRKIGAEVLAINMLLESAAAPAICRIEERQAAASSMLEGALEKIQGKPCDATPVVLRVEKKLESHVAAFTAFQNALLATVQDLALPRSPNVWTGIKPVRLVTFDTQILLPFEFCASRKKFQRALELVFEDRPGYAFVQAGWYQAFREGEGEGSEHAFLDESSWKSAVHPDAAISLNLLMWKKQALKGTMRSYKVACAGCGNIYQDSIGTGIHWPERILCKVCYTWVPISYQEPWIMELQYHTQNTMSCIHLFLPEAVREHPQVQQIFQQAAPSAALETSPVPIDSMSRFPSYIQRQLFDDVLQWVRGNPLPAQMNKNKRKTVPRKLSPFQRVKHWPRALHYATNPCENCALVCARPQRYVLNALAPPGNKRLYRKEKTCQCMSFAALECVNRVDTDYRRRSMGLVS